MTAYRTVRAAPPPAPVRDAIKTGKFDAVVFTSSSTVRNLVGIAGKPHASTVIAAIGPATAKTCEEHGLRVDVLAPSPSIEHLAEALAEFGAARRPVHPGVGVGRDQAIGATHGNPPSCHLTRHATPPTRRPIRWSGRAGCARRRRLRRLVGETDVPARSAGPADVRRARG